MNRLIPRKRLMESKGLFIAILLAGFSCVVDAVTLEDEFRSPPHPAKPWVYWINMDGHFTKEGITADSSDLSPTSELTSEQLANGIKYNNAGMHPVNKSGYGARDARVALGGVYGKDVEIYGPVYKSHKIEGNKVIISFDHVGKGLVFKKGESIDKLQGFTISGDAKTFNFSRPVFVWADAVIEGNTVVVSSDKVLNPVAVRYAWAIEHPWANLFNKDGLPALPFSTYESVK